MSLYDFAFWMSEMYICVVICAYPESIDVSEVKMTMFHGPRI
jgi:hypothetical protein